MSSESIANPPVSPENQEVLSQENINQQIENQQNSPDTITDIISDPEVASPEVGVIDHYPQVQLKSVEDKILMILPPEVETPAALTFGELVEQLQQRLVAGDRFWQPQTKVHVVATDRLLDGRQLQTIVKALHQGSLVLEKVITNRRQTAVAAASAGYSVEQKQVLRSLHQPPDQQILAESLYLETTVRSGREINYPGTVVILGDVNAGGLVVAAGDILIWGKLKGVAHAGAKGNAKCRIMALEMQPTQIRIADIVARAPESPPAQYYPEVAYITPEGIRIARAMDFSRNS